MFVCDECDKEFKLKDNMLRHEKIMHEMELDREDSNDSEATTDESGEDLASGDEEETIDPWFDMIEYVFGQLQSDFNATVHKIIEDDNCDQKKARERAFKKLLPRYRKLLIDKYLYKILWYESVRKDPVHQAIKQSAKRLREEDDFDGDESWKYAAEKRKYLFDKVLKEYNPPRLTDTV